MRRVIGSIFLAYVESLRVEEMVVGASVNSINDREFQVYKHCLWHMLVSACLTKKDVEEVTSPTMVLVGQDVMFQAVELPVGIADLDTSLANVDGDALTLCRLQVAALQMPSRWLRGREEVVA